MKKILVIVILGLFPSLCFSQKIKKHEIDKFTKSEIMETSTETLYKTYYIQIDHKFDFCIRKVDDTYSMPADILMDDMVKYTENDGVSFLLDNDEVVRLATNYSGIGAEEFGQGYWFHTSFDMTAADVEKLKNHKVLSVRITYLGGYYDKDLKGGKQVLIQKMLKLFDK